MPVAKDKKVQWHPAFYRAMHLELTLAEIMNPQIDEAFNNGFDNGVDNGKILVFQNMVKNGMSGELA